MGIWSGERGGEYIKPLTDGGYEFGVYEFFWASRNRERYTKLGVARTNADAYRRVQAIQAARPQLDHRRSHA